MPRDQPDSELSIPQKLAAMASNFERRERQVSRQYALTELMADLNEMHRETQQEQWKIRGLS